MKIILNVTCSVRKIVNLASLFFIYTLLIFRSFLGDGMASLNISEQELELHRIIQYYTRKWNLENFPASNRRNLEVGNKESNQNYSANITYIKGYWRNLELKSEDLNENNETKEPPIILVFFATVIVIFVFFFFFAIIFIYLLRLYYKWVGRWESFIHLLANWNILTLILENLQTLNVWIVKNSY